MTGDATASPTGREEALAHALARAHDALAAKIALIEAEQSAGAMSQELAAQQAAAAQAVYDRNCALARVEADTGWHTWTGVGGVLYARRPKSTPPMVVHAATAEALAVAIERPEAGRLI